MPAIPSVRTNRRMARLPDPSQASAALLMITLCIGGWSGLVTPAHGFAYTEIIDFDLSETTRTYDTFSMSSIGDGSMSYRWTDDPDHTTVISGNRCSDLALYGKREIAPHRTTYHQIFQANPYTCFALRGRVAFGAGGMYDHDGMIRR